MHWRNAFDIQIHLLFLILQSIGFNGNHTRIISKKIEIQSMS